LKLFDVLCCRRRPPADVPVSVGGSSHTGSIPQQPGPKPPPDETLSDSSTTHPGIPALARKRSKSPRRDEAGGSSRPGPRNAGVPTIQISVAAETSTYTPPGGEALTPADRSRESSVRTKSLRFAEPPVQHSPSRSASVQSSAKSSPRHKASTIGDQASALGVPFEPQTPSQIADARLRQIIDGGEQPENLEPAMLSLEGFERDAADVLEAICLDVRRGLGDIFPRGYNDILIENASHSDLARTHFYGKEASIDFNYEAHLDPEDPEADVDDPVVSAGARGRMAQTLTHEIVLHMAKEFLIYRSEDKQVPGMDGHRDACIGPSRDNYLVLSSRVLQQLPEGQRPAFATEWHREIVSLARDPKTGLTEEETADAVAWADRGRLAMAPIPLSPSGSKPSTLHP
jgi:hypothetical protein